MINKMIRGFTRILGKPESWDPETHGRCGALAVMDHKHVAVEGGPEQDSMISAWDITPDELVRLRQGAPVYLRVAGRAHPPVAIWVGFPSLEASDDQNELAVDEIEEFRERVLARVTQILVDDPACGGRVTTETVERLAKFVVDARLGGRAEETG